jgi:diguanylate cyclase (GGDEF)-like protein
MTGVGSHAAVTSRARIFGATAAGVVMGAVGLAAALSRIDTDEFSARPWLVAVMAAAVAITWIWPLRVYRGDGVVGLQLDDGLLVTSLLILQPIEVLLAFGIGLVVGSWGQPIDAHKRIFNVGQTLGAVGLAVVANSAVASLTGIATQSPGPAVAGAAVFWLATSLAVALALTWVQRGNFLSLLSDNLAFRLLFWSASVSLGLLVGLSAQSDLRRLAFSLIPLLVLEVALSGHRQAHLDRERIAGLLDATIRAYGSTRIDEVRAAIADAARGLLQCASSGIGLVRPDDSLGVRLPVADGDHHWLWVDDPWDGRDFTPTDQRLLEALASVAGGALENAHLVEEIQAQAFHDSLTGLPNHVLFDERLTSALARARSDGTRVAVAFFDLDRFKGVNDSLGHSIGDDLLTRVSDRLTNGLRPGDTVARLGGDEFTLLWTGLDDPDDARWRCEELLARFRAPIRLAGQDVFVTGSIGVAVFPDDGTIAQTLVRRADLAMYEAKRSGRNAYRFWVRAHEATLPDLRREGELHAAIDDGQLLLYYQPVIDLAGGAIHAVEALARWHHPQAGLLLPDEFIGLAEELGLVTLIDGWVLQHATEQMAEWRASGITDVDLAVNVSARRFEDLSFVELVAAQLQRTGLPPSSLQLEMTESAAIRDASDTVLKLNELGVALVMDDFGTGYSMLSRLRSFPLDALKIDRSFMGDNPDDRALVEAIIGLGHSLGLEVVAEGVETVEQHERLRRLGCDYAQGFYYCRPLPADRAVQVLHRGR